MPAIETSSLSKQFGDITAVDGLTLTVESGEVFGFLGPNGAGKSTTINMLLGFLTPSSGDIRVLGTDVTEDSLAVRQRSGLLPEGYQPYPNLTGREHVTSAISAKGVDEDPDALLARVGLDPDDARRPAKSYSTGMVKRMSLAVALVGEPDLLILDEPSSGLDPDGVALFREVIRDVSDRGATVFFSSHILEEVEKVCDRVGIIDNGAMVATDTIDNLRADIGAGASVTVETETVPSDELMTAVRSLSGVRSVTLEDSRLVAEVTDPGVKMPVLREVDERAKISDIRIEEAPLEALFDRYTGENNAPSSTTGEEVLAGGED